MSRKKPRTLAPITVHAYALPIAEVEVGDHLRGTLSSGVHGQVKALASTSDTTTLTVGCICHGDQVNAVALPLTAYVPVALDETSPRQAGHVQLDAFGAPLHGGPRALTNA